MALDMQDRVDPPDPPMTPDRMDEIRQLARCVEFVDEKKALREMRGAVVDLLRELDELIGLRDRHAQKGK